MSLSGTKYSKKLSVSFWIFAYAAAISVKLWLVVDLPIVALHAPADDYLFVTQALSIAISLSGQSTSSQ